MVLKIFKTSNNKNINNNKVNDIIKIFSQFNKLKNNKSEILIHLLNIETIKKPIFLTFSTKKVFNYLR